MLAAAPSVAAAPKQPAAPRPDAAAWLLYDPDDKDELAAHAAGRELPMASTTKLMTAYLAREALKPGAEVTAAPYSPGPGESLMGLRPGESVSVEDLLYGLLLASGNDAAVTLAVAAEGSEGAFVARMNREARRLGLDDTGYENPIGFDGPGHHTTARDLVDLAIILRRDPLIQKITDSPSATVESGGRVRRIANRNTLVARVPWVDGVKTGFTDGAGYVLVGSGERKGVTLVSAVLGTPSEFAREQGTLDLLRYGFSLYDEEEVIRKGKRLGDVAIRDRDVVVPIVARQGVELTVRRDQDIEIAAKGIPPEVKGPVSRGDRFGTAIVTVDGEQEARVPLVAASGADAASLIERIDAALPGSRAGAWGLLALGALAVLLLIVIPVAWIVRRRREPG